MKTYKTNGARPGDIIFYYVENNRIIGKEIHTPENAHWGDKKEWADDYGEEDWGPFDPSRYETCEEVL